LTNSVYKSELGYFKPHKLEGVNVRFLPGEIDFVVQSGKRIIPIEVKLTDQISQIELSVFKEFMHKNKSPFGIVIYGGAPYMNKDLNIIYWPYWMI
jgi:predicted AAA+ superfamily ATPase